MVKSPGKPERRPLPPWKHTYEEFIQKFPDTMTPRPAQEETFRRLADGFKKGKRFALVEMSTGGGKSPVAKTAADVVAREGGAFMITAQKALQDQYCVDVLMLMSFFVPANSFLSTPQLLTAKGISPNVGP